MFSARDELNSDGEAENDNELVLTDYDRVQIIFIFHIY